MAIQIQEGHLGNLTPEQQNKLRDLWSVVFAFNELLEESDATTSDTATQPKIVSTSTSPFKLPGSRSTTGQHETAHPVKPSISIQQIKSLLKVHNLNEDEFADKVHHALTIHTASSIRSKIIMSVKHEHPDALALRFLRARKWDVGRALLMIFSAMNWRYDEACVDSEILFQGEGGAVRDETSDNLATRTMARDFLKQMRMGKSFVHGTDRANRPICMVRARLHKASDQHPKSIERYTTFLIETTRLTLDPPVETACLLFDLTGFGLANMDYVPVKFLISCFEANYPESLGVILINNAPWVFKGIWRIIRGWLDPVVAAKVHFTYGRKDLEKFIEPKQLIKELGGEEDWEFRYEEPQPGENDRMEDTATRDKLVEERFRIVHLFEIATREWIQAASTGGSTEEIEETRNNLALQFRDVYWKLDPYIRARSLYDRQGVIRGGAPVRWYLNERGQN